MAAPPSLKKVLWSVAGFLTASTALMGFAHTKPGRPLLALLSGGQKPALEQAKSGGGSCPMGFSKKSDPAGRDLAFKEQADKLRGSERALSRPALGFTLDKTTKADVDSWAKANHITCKVPKVGADLDCSKVPAELLSQGGPAASSVWFTFDSHDRLVSLTAIRYDNDPSAAASFYSTIVNSLSKSAGPPAQIEGESTADYLSETLLRQTKSSFAFNDYHAQTSVTQLRQGEFMLVEEYRSLPN